MAHRHRLARARGTGSLSRHPLKIPPILLGLLLAASAQAGRPPAEALAYEVFWGGMLVGRARIETLPTTDTDQFMVRTTAKANNAIQSIYPVLDTVESWIKVPTGLPLKFHKRLNEGRYSASVLIALDHSEGVARIRGGHKKGGAPDTTVEIADSTHDLLSAFHAVRNGPLSPGTSTFINIIDNRKVFKRVEIACLRRETIEGDDGKRWNTLLIQPRLHGEALFNSKGKLFIWLTDDERRIPVRMVSEIKLGSIKAILTSHVP